jgi:hypothetical protein
VWWERALFFSKYFSSLLSASFHQNSTPIFIHLLLILYNPSKYVSIKASLSPICFDSTVTFLARNKGLKNVKTWPPNTK